jgi:hypothetical protein
MSLFAYAGLFFACAVIAALLGSELDQHFGRSEDFTIFVWTFVAFIVFLLCGVIALAWGALRAMGWLP